MCVSGLYPPKSEIFDGIPTASNDWCLMYNRIDGIPVYRPSGSRRYPLDFCSRFGLWLAGLFLPSSK